MKKCKSRKKELHLGTFNVRGINSVECQSNLSKDIDKFEVDICCLQETKIKDGCDKQLGDTQLICLPTEQKDYGQGFLINKEWQQRTHKIWRVNDRIAVAQFKLKDDIDNTKLTKKSRKPRKIWMVKKLEEMKMALRVEEAKQ